MQHKKTKATGRRKAPPPPQPLESPPDLFVLMELAGVTDFTGSLGAAYRCPLCLSHPRDFSYEFGGEKPPELRSLRVFLNLQNEVVVRCHFCGFADSALALIRAANTNSNDSWDHLVEELKVRKAFGDSSVPEHWIERARKSEMFSDLFERAKARFRREFQRSETGRLIKGLRFGEIGTLRGRDLRKIFPEAKLPFTKGGPPAAFNVELHRSLYGLPLRIVIRACKDGTTVDEIYIQPPEAISLAVPDWSLYRDWTEEITICTDYQTAVRLQDLAVDEPETVQTPLALVWGCNRTIVDEIPFRRIRCAYGDEPDQNAEFALAFTHAAGRVTASQAQEYREEDWPLPRYRLLEEQDAFEAVADQIIDVRVHGANPVGYLNAILDKPWISHASGQQLTRVVAARLGETADSLISQSGATNHVLPLHTDKATYLGRNGVYIKARDRKRQDFRPCSNFSLELLESTIDENDQPIAHRLRLRMGSENTEFTSGTNEFGNGRRLLEAATAAAIKNGFSVLPVCPEPTDVRMLPELVRSTVLKTRTIRGSTKLGFYGDAFHGPDFTVTANGIRPVRNQAPGEAGWMLPEGLDSFAGSRDDYLRHKANQLASWISQLNEKQQTSVGVLLYAAIHWLHRGFRKLLSPLLLPSRQHLDLFGKLLGLIPIEFGRTSRFARGIPRLMAFPYWQPNQFERQGQMVVAIEAPDRRVSSNIPIVVHQIGDHEEASKTESSFLSLIAFSCLGASGVDGAVAKFCNLSQRLELQQTLGDSLEKGKWYFADSGRYLDQFLGAVDRHRGLEDSLIESRRGQLLRRSVVKSLLGEHGYGFRETRLIEEFRRASGAEQPTRFGKALVPAFLLPGS